MRHSSFSALALVALLAACSDDPTGPGDDTATLNLDVASAAADATAEDVDAMATMSGELGTITFAASLSDGPPQGPGNTNGCGFGGARWTCPSNSANGITITRSLAFFDGDGIVQEDYDVETTEMIDIEMTLEANVTRGPWTAETFRERHLEITGLEGDEETRMVNGEGSEEISRTRTGAGNSPNRSYELEGTFTIEDVVMPVVEGDEDHWPLSGTVTRIYTVTRTGEDPVTRTVIIEFDGTATPPATVNGEPFEIDLSDRDAHRP
jgi:hypothetical protein